MTAALLLLLLPAGEPVRAREVLGERGVAVVAAADRVDVFRLGPLELEDVPESPPPLEKLNVRARASRADPSYLTRLAAALLRDDAYRPSDHGEQVGLMFADVVFRLWAAAEVVEVFVSFRADLVAAREPGSAEFGWAYELRHASDLLELAREAFPEDRDLQWIQPRRARAKTARDLLGPAAAILEAPGQAEAYGIRPRPIRPREIADLEVTLTRPMTPHTSTRLAAVLTDDSTYDFETYKPCAFVPNVAFRVRGARGTAEVILCFGCSELVVNVQDPAGSPAYLAGGYFEGDRLLSLAEDALGRKAVRRILREARPSGRAP
jgi:hypothetical protein